MTYTYNPLNIGEKGLDRMRFELGDVMAGGGAETCALCDEEIRSVLDANPGKWGFAKYKLAESVLFRFSYEVDTNASPLSLALSQRFTAWKTLYDKLKKQVWNQSIPRVPPPPASCFRVGMMDDPQERGDPL